ncbi:hypothetical protein DB346_24465 [Verrucomicrobia bacterium LW23]|nr:hypothetical protein DB346_24465 [Verrucomicrobia bacterium LW23]
MTFRQSEGIVWIEDVAYTEASVRQRYDVSLPAGMVHRSYGVIAPGVEEWSDGRNAYPQAAPSLPYADILADIAHFEPINPPEPEPPEVDPIEEARLEAIRLARAAVAAAGITVASDVGPLQLWCRGESDYLNYGVLLGQLRSAADLELPDRPYRISTMQGGVDLPDRASLIVALTLYTEQAQLLYEAII